MDEMLRSIQTQTYTDFKVIISDDCSPEDLQSICEPYLSDPRFTYRRNKENIGSKSLVSHWNLLVDMCDTEYLILASDDDVYEPQFLEEIDRLTGKYPEVDLFKARGRRIDEENKTLINEGLFEEKVDQLHFIHHFLLSNHISCIANYCFRTKSLQNTGGFVKFPLAWFTDDATTMMMAEHGCCYTRSVLFSFRSSSVNISGIWGDDKDSKAKIDAILSFNNWFSIFFNQKFERGYKEEPLLPDIVRRQYESKLKGNVEGYIPYLKTKDIYKYARRCKRELSVSFVVLLYYWLRRTIASQIKICK